jgi:hypothetical protein
MEEEEVKALKIITAVIVIGSRASILLLLRP